MNKNILMYYEIAKKLKLPVTYLTPIQCLRIQLGRRNYYFKDMITPINNGSSIYLSKNKHTLLLLLQKAGFPVPNHICLYKKSDWHELLPKKIQALKFPVVIKPTLNTRSGEGVVCNIKTLTDLFVCLEKNFEQYASIQIEEFHQGLKEYQVLLLKNKTIRVVERASDHSVGNNKHRLSLKNTIHTENAKYLRQASIITGLGLVGFDVLCEDINIPFSRSRWVIIEANFSPEISVHEPPEDGGKMNIHKKILMQIIFCHPFVYIKHRINLFFKQYKKI